MDALSQILFGGLFQGSLYAMMSVGLALIWTTIGVFNFSHGVFMMLGAYLAWQFASPDAAGLPMALGFPLAVIVAAAFGWALQAAVVRPFIGRHDLVLVVVITTLATASLTENGVLEFWGPRAKQLPPLATGLIAIGPLSVSVHQVVIIAVTPVVLLALWLFLTRTRLGLALRAVAQNEDASLLVGLDVKALYGLAFALSAALAALAGLFLGGYRFMSPGMGADPLLKALIVVVFGGLSGIAGPIAAAYLIGLFEAVSDYFLGLYWTPALLFLVLVGVLMVRPEGLFSTGRARDSHEGSRVKASAPKGTPGRLPASAEALAFLAGFAALAALPLGVTDGYGRHVLIMAFIYAVIASNWDLSLGYGGIFNFAHIALFGIGVYTYGILAKVLVVEPWAALGASGVVATLAAAIVTVPTLRLKGIYIILVTFGFSQLVMQIVLSQSGVTGGTEGLVRIPTLRLGDHNMVRDGKLAYFYIALTMLGLSTAFLRGFARSRLGLATVALRDNAEYATSRGVSLAWQRLLTLAASAFFTGVAGGFYAAYQRNASIDVFGMSLSTTILSMVLLGGTGTIYGPIVASFVLTIFSESLANWGPWRPMITAVLIIGVMLAYPAGLGGLVVAIATRMRDVFRRGPSQRTEAVETSHTTSA